MFRLRIGLIIQVRRFLNPKLPANWDCSESLCTGPSVRAGTHQKLFGSGRSRKPDDHQPIRTEVDVVFVVEWTTSGGVSVNFGGPTQKNEVRYPKSSHIRFVDDCDAAKETRTGIGSFRRHIEERKVSVLTFAHARRASFGDFSRCASRRDT